MAWQTCVTVSPCGGLVALGTGSGIELRDLRAGESRWLSAGNGLVHARRAAFSPGGLYVAAEFGNEADRQPSLVGVWDAHTGRRQRTFDTAAFALPAQYQFGNSGYNILEGDGIINLDLGLAKRWVMGEEHDVQFRVEFFNLANHANFGIPGGAVDSGAFGRVTSASTARQIQFGLRYRF